jgi:NTE family protein
MAEEWEIENAPSMRKGEMMFQILKEHAEEGFEIVGDGVLEVLQQLNVPVDCVAGTSMGALVAGAWAAGLTPQEMRAQLAAADWADMFQDNPAFVELNFRNKRLSQRYFPGSETGITERGAVSPPGVVSGQKIKLFINQLVRADAGERSIESLPLKLAIIATDIGTGERVAYTDGSLTQAMRASMAVPGLLSPVEYRGRKLVDGGLVDNVPIGEVRRMCDAERVIVVNVGSPLLAPEDVVGLLSISAQMVALLTEQNVSRSLATLQLGDVYIQPDLGDITAGAYDRHAEAAERGRAAAVAATERLQALAVSPVQFAAWRHRLEGRERPVPRVDEIEVVGLGRVNPAVVQRYLRQPLGEPLDTVALNRDLLRAYGDGHYEGVDHRVIESIVDLELSIGDYVLTNGAIAAAVVCDAIIRLLPGALGDERSSIDESFTDPNLLEAPAYTRPIDFQGMKVPEILHSGNHAKNALWKHQQAHARTRANRPDLLP